MEKERQSDAKYKRLSIQGETDEEVGREICRTVKIIDGGLHSFLFSLFYLIFLSFYVLFSIFRTNSG